MSLASVLREEYDHFRSCGISPELTVAHLANLYTTTPNYVRKSRQEAHS